MLEVSFRYRHGCPVNQLSEKYPEVLMAQWCNFKIEVLEMHTRDARLTDEMRVELGKLRADGGEGFKVLRDAEGAKGARTLLLKCPHRPGRSVDGIIESHDCLYLPPVLYRNGWEEYRAIALDEAQLPAMFKELAGQGTVELTGKREMAGELMRRAFMVSAESLLSDLTPKQAAALLAAIEHGYYRVPRKTRFEDIARARKVPRTTFEEHVRKAESKVIQAMAPYVALYTGGK